ncbi:MAG: PASTA domain-containing protein [bacterium]|nr:PASTA domain-containing protein [bacterium]
MSKQRRWILIGGIAALVLLPWLIYAADSARSNGEVARNVSAAGIDLGGLGEEDARAVLLDYGTQLAQTTARSTVKDETFILKPADVDLDIDEEAILALAMEQRRGTGFFSGFFAWIGSFGDPVDLVVPVSVDEDLLDEILGDWEAEAIDLPAYEGGVVVRDTRVLPDYPRPGEGIDRTHAQQVILAGLQTLERRTLNLETVQIEPELTNADVDAATLDAAKLIDSPTTLSADDPEFSVIFSREELAAALVSDVTSNPGATIVLSFDPEQIEPVLLPLKPEIEQPPRDAEFVINEETSSVSLKESRPATLLDADLVAASLADAAASPGNSGEFPFGYGSEPAFTTAEAEAMGDIGFVSDFTTSHPAGQARVTNIHLIADAIDGAMVLPGHEFSLNEYVGQRTTEKGYVPAPMILAGKLVDDVGGGVSQFATTFYNASFFGCYEDVDHKPHSYYFSRYPEVNEATISWPVPNLTFRNNTDTVVIIKTQYTATDITVQFYGNNGGCVAERQLGSRYNFTDPPEEYVANSDLTPLDEKVTQSGWGGFSNTVKRIMTYPDGTVIEEEYVWVYRPAPKIREVHSCNIPSGDPPDCPVQVPALLGGTSDGARAAVEALGLVFVEGPTVGITEEANSGLIVDQTPESGEWVDVGTTITISVGVYVPPEEPPPDDGGDGDGGGG